MNEATGAMPARPGAVAWFAAPAGAIVMLLLLPALGGFAALLGLALVLIGVVAAVGRGWLALLWSVGWGLIVVVVCLMLNGAMGHWR